MKAPKFIRRHKIALALATACALLVVAAAAWYLSPHDQPPADGGQGDQAQEEQAEDRQAQQPEEIAADGQVLAQVQDYSSAERELQDLLNAKIWSSSDTDSARFYDGLAVFTKSGKQETHSFLIKALGEKESSSSAQNAPRTSQPVSVEIDGDAAVMLVRQTLTSDGGIASTSISSDALPGGNSEMAASQPVEKFTISGFTENDASRLGVDPAKVTDALADYCSQRYPTAVSATWDGTATSDYQAETLSIPFTLTNKSKTSLTVTWDMLSAKAVSVSNGTHA